MGPLRKVLFIHWWLLFVLPALLICCQQHQNRRLCFAHVYDALAGPQGQANMAWIKGRIAAYERIHPDLPVTLEQVKWDQIDTKCMADYRAGIRHDLVMSSPQLLSKHRVVGDLLDLNRFVSWNNEELEDFVWNPVWRSCEQEGQLLGMPLGAHTRLVAYRKDMFTEVGLDPEKPPRTLTQTVEFAKRLTRDTDGDGKVDVWGLGIYFGPSRATIELSFAPILWHFGGALWNKGSKKAIFASDAGVQAAQFLRDLVAKYRVTPRWALSGTYDDVILRGFLNGKLAMAWGWGSYWIQPLEEAGWIKGCFPPSREAHTVKAGVFLTPTRVHAQFTNAWTLSIHAVSEHAWESFELLETFLKPEALRAFPDAGLPARLSEWTRPEYQTPFYRVWFEAIKKGRPMPATAHYEELASYVSAALQEILVKNAAVGPTLLKFQEAYNARYAGE